ncbi:MAG: FHA domain-containing protein, partial [Chlamydiia bacterium]|nr:FHA domain-containing protein [Chlamydiia bacterium]
MVYKLIAEQGDLAGLELALEEGDEWVLGSDKELCQLVLEDESVAKMHLVLRRTPEGISVQNLSDNTPAEVNGEAVGEPVVLEEGDEIKLGAGVYRFATGEEEEVS